MIERSCIPLAVYQFLDRRVVTIALSDGFCRLFGYERERAYYLMDHDMYADTHPDDVSRIADAAFRFATQGGEYNVVYRTRRDDGYIIIHAFGEHKNTATGERIAVVWYNNEGVYRDDGGLGGYPLDLTFSSALHKETLYQKNAYDALTGLPNMTYFFTLAEAGFARMKAQGKQPVLLYFDLNGMKFYNSQFGFAAGDRLIASFAKILAGRFSNENCSRFGADQFAVYTEETDVEQILRDLFEEAKGLCGGNSLPVRVGIYPERFESVEISAACDRAKYACDAHRGYLSGFYYFNASMLKKVRRHRYIINNLDRAMQERWILVYYQPIIRTANGRVCNEEALCRWIDPQEGLISPGELIPVLEESKLIYKLDLYMLDRILEKINDQRGTGLHIVPQSLNLSRVDFDVCDIVEEVRSRVDAAGVPRSEINIELTESMIGQDFEFMKQQIKRFRDLGFHVWMDDFGSGYSSLDLLQSLRFDQIKLDMRFMQQFDADEKSRVILTELVRMAIGLGIDTVAEGVERPDQVDFLREIGCTKLQGFYFCKAIPLDAIIERYRKGVQIGFENPAESDYYAAIGRINLYDMSTLFQGGEESGRLPESMPMAIFEVDGTGMGLIQGNRPFRTHLQRAFGVTSTAERVRFSTGVEGSGAAYEQALIECREPGKRVFFEEDLPDGSMVHAMVRHVALNPVTGAYACVMAVLGVTDPSERRVTYTSVAQALAADYIYLYYINLDTGRFIEYSSERATKELNVERRGTDFFGESLRRAPDLLHPEDCPSFVAAFTKENVVRAIDRTGAFTRVYRMRFGEGSRYVSMNAVRMTGDTRHILIGIKDVDRQMRLREADERSRQIQATNTILRALSGDYLSMFLVDPETDAYTTFSAMDAFRELGLPDEGTDFFADVRGNIRTVIHPDDLNAFLRAFTKENVLKDVQKNGLFVFRYRLCIGRTVKYVRIKAALAEDQGISRLIVGINDIDARLRNEREYLTEADRSKQERR